MTLHEHFYKLEQDIRAKIKQLHKVEYAIDILISARGIECKASHNSYDWFPVFTQWSQFDKPDLYALALNKMLELYKVTEKPLAYLEKSDRVELTYPTYTAILDKNLLLQKR